MECRSTNAAETSDQANSVQALAWRDWMHLTVSCSQSWTWVIFHINGESAGRVMCAIHIDIENGLDGSYRDGFSNERGMI